MHKQNFAHGAGFQKPVAEVAGSHLTDKTARREGWPENKVAVTGSKVAQGS